MSFRPALRRLALTALIALLGGKALGAGAYDLDPAVVGERIQRLNATVEALEQASTSQQRRIDTLGTELGRLREETTRELARNGAQRPWSEDLLRQSDEIKRHTEDLKRLAEAISEVDRKRAADHEQVLKVLGELRKAITAMADAPPGRSSPNRSAPESPRSTSRRDNDRSSANNAPVEPAPAKSVPYTVGRGDTLSLIVESFNADAGKKGYLPVTVSQVMKFNKITDARRLAAGAQLNLPLYPQTERP